MSKKSKNYKEIEEAIDVINEHEYIVYKAQTLFDNLKDSLTKTEKEKYPSLLDELGAITY